MQGKYYNHETIRLWDFDIFICFDASWIHLGYFYGDVCMYVYVCMCVPVRVHVCANDHDSVKTMHSIEFKFGMLVTDHRRTNPIDKSDWISNWISDNIEYRINSSFLQDYKKKFLYITVYGIKFFNVF